MTTLRAPRPMSVERSVEEQKLRLAQGIAEVKEALRIPRRLGQDASGEELAMDKRICRRVLHRLQSLYEDWNEGEPCADSDLPDVHGAGARISWIPWWVQWLDNLQKWKEFYEGKDAHMRYIHRVKREIEELEQCLS